MHSHAYMSCHYHACLQNMCLFDQFLDLVESIRNGGHCNEYVELTRGCGLSAVIVILPMFVSM